MAIILGACGAAVVEGATKAIDLSRVASLGVFALPALLLLLLLILLRHWSAIGTTCAAEFSPADATLLAMTLGLLTGPVWSGWIWPNKGHPNKTFVLVVGSALVAGVSVRWLLFVRTKGKSRAANQPAPGNELVDAVLGDGALEALSDLDDSDALARSVWTAHGARARRRFSMRSQDAL